MTELPGIYRDWRGLEPVVFQTTGTSLFTIVRGVRFTGTDFDGLRTDDRTDQFELLNGDLCGCEFEVIFPVRLIAPDGLRSADLQVTIILGHSDDRGGLDMELVRISLTQPEFSVTSHGKSGWFEDELLALVDQLPSGFSFEACITCGLSDYSPAGHGSFGCMACFRDAAAEYRKVHTKAEIFGIWDKLTEFVQETHYCEQFERRPQGRGYRG